MSAGQSGKIRTEQISKIKYDGYIENIIKNTPIKQIRYQRIKHSIQLMFHKPLPRKYPQSPLPGNYKNALPSVYSAALLLPLVKLGFTLSTENIQVMNT